jgi:hypothetical protein
VTSEEIVSADTKRELAAKVSTNAIISRRLKGFAK